MTWQSRSLLGREISVMSLNPFVGWVEQRETHQFQLPIFKPSQSLLSQGITRTLKSSH